MKATQFLFVILCAAGMAAPIQAAKYAESADSCNTRCYECGCNPLNECSWGLQFAAGVRPIIWKHRGDFLAINCNESNPLVVLGELPRFSNLYKTPWQVGFQLSYATSCNTNLFGEFNYAQASSKCDSYFIDNTNLQINLSKFKLYEAYFGGRYYFDRWCDRVAFFLGAKVGLIHHKKIRTGSFTGTSENSLITDCCDDLTRIYDFCDSHNSFAGGAHLGFDVCLTGNLSFVMTAEIVATCGCGCGNRFDLNIVDSAFLNASSLITPGVMTELAFPVTFGLKYNF